MSDRDRLATLILEARTTAPMNCFLDEWIADHLLSNGVIVPPCKVGDTVYFVVEYDGKYFLDEGEVGSVYSDNGGIWISARYNSGLCYHHKANDDFGKTVFLTREEAEQALRERSKK